MFTLTGIFLLVSFKKASRVLLKWHYCTFMFPGKWYITGSAVALHCCKAHSKSIGKRENLTPCKIVTPENIILKLLSSLKGTSKSDAVANSVD